MTAAMLVLEPIFEADLPPEQYGSLGGDDQNWAADETPGFDFGALSPPERIAKAVEWGAVIHPQYKNEFDNGGSTIHRRSAAPAIGATMPGACIIATSALSTAAWS